MLRPDTFALTALLAFLTSFGPLSVDLYLPSMPAIAAALAAPPAHVQLTISLYLIGFAIGAYDPDYPVVIDPILVYSTYLAGNDFETGMGIAIDPTGNAYVAGWSGSADFPATTGAFQTTQAPSRQGDAFVTKLNPAGTAIIYSTYLGGSGNGHLEGEGGGGIAVDASGSAYVTGYTTSSDFPTANALQPPILHRRRSRSIRTDLIRAEVLVPNDVLAEGGDERPVRGTVLGRNPYGKRRRALAHETRFARSVSGQDGLSKNELRLSSADQFDIDLGEEFRVEQGAMLAAARIVDRVAGAKIIQSV